MSDEGELSISELRRKRAQSAANSAPPKHAGEIQPIIIDSPARAVPMNTPVQARGMVSTQRPVGREMRADPSFDSARLWKALRQRWHWMFLGAIVFGAAGCGVAYWDANYTIPVTLTLRDGSLGFVPGADTESYRPPQLSSQTMVNFLTSPEFLRYVAAQASPPLTEKKLRSRLTVDQEKNSETITASLKGKNLKELVSLASFFTIAAVEKSREAQMENPGLTYTNFMNELVRAEKEEASLKQQLISLRTNTGMVDPVIESSAYEKAWTDLQLKIDMRESDLMQLEVRDETLRNEPIQRSLRDAEDRLTTLRAQGKLNEHPDVRRVLAEINELKRQLSGADPKNAASSSDVTETFLRKKSLAAEIQALKNQAAKQKERIDRLYENAGDYAQVKAKLDFVEKFRKALEKGMFEARQYRNHAEGYYKAPPPPALEDVDSKSRLYAAAAGGCKGGLAGLALIFSLVYCTERLDPRLKTAADVKGVARLPVLATLGDLKKMDDAARKAWAFRTWTILSGTLGQSANQGTVCGIISCAHGEGRTTWVEMLVEAARQRGFEVTKLDFQEVANHSNAASEADDNKATQPAAASNAASLFSPSNALATVADQKLVPARGTSVIHVQLPGLVWDLERRIQFQQELEKWQAVSHAVVLVDLPPASVPEAVLLAENLPQVLWLVDSGKSHARETRLHLETLRHARCKLVGAVLNHEPEPLMKL